MIRDTFAASKGQVQVSKVMKHAGLGLYWAADNMVYLQKAKFHDSKTDWAYWSCFGWSVGIFGGLAISFKTISDLIATRSQIARKFSKSEDVEEKASLARSLSDTSASLRKEILLVVAALGDLCVALNGVKLTHYIKEGGFHNGELGVAGLVSALITGYYHWKSMA